MVVYGARPQIDANLAQHNYEPIYHKHIRATDAPYARAGQAGRRFVAARYHRPAVDEPQQHAAARCAYQRGQRQLHHRVQPLGVDDGIDYCHSGRILAASMKTRSTASSDSNAIVLIGPVAVSVTGESSNLTSEEVVQLAIC